jgi:putative ABC transport system permease protein
MRGPRALTAAILPLAARHLARRRIVAGVAALGLVAAVASLMATELLYVSVVASYERTAEQFAGRAAFEVSNGDSGVAEELADELRQVPGVRAVAASVEGFVATPDLPGERLYLYGVDLLADQEVRDYGAGSQAVVSDPMVFLAAPDSVGLTGAFARAHGLALNDRLRVLTPAGVETLTVRALLGKQEGPATALDGRLAIVDLSVAQDLLGLERRVSQLAIAVAAGADLAIVERAISARVGVRGVVERPRARTAAFARLLTNYRNGLLLAAAVAGVVALYFLCNLATIAIVERRREMALLRALGMSATSIVVMATAELALLSAAATALGVPLGFGLAYELLASFGSGVATLYADVGRPTLSFDVRSVLACTVLGVATPVVAALAPLRRTFAIRPVEALQALAEAGQAPPRHCRSVVIGGVLILTTGIVWLTRGWLPFSVDAAGMTAMLGAVAGVATCVPAVVYVLAARVERVAGASGRIVPLLAARAVRNDLRRVAVTCAAVVVSLAGSIAIATWVSSLDRTVGAAFDTVFAHIDLVVSGGADPFAREAIRIPAAVAAEIGRWPEVAAVDAVRVDSIAFAGSRAAIVAGDTRLYVDRRRRLSVVEGDEAFAAAGLASGTAVVVNQAFARRFGRRPGDVLELGTPNGPLRLRIAAIHLELTPGDLGTIHLDRELYRRWWRDDSATLVEVSLRSGADRRHVIAAIRSRFGERHRLVVFTIEELRRTYRDLLGRMTALVDPLLAVAMLCALIGVASTEAAALMARRRTTEVLCAVGLTRAQLARVVGCELAIVGVIAAGMAAVVGSALGWLQVEVLLRGMLGMAVLYAYPRGLALAVTTAVVVGTMLVGWMLGRRAGRVSAGGALQWE